MRTKQLPHLNRILSAKEVTKGQELILCELSYGISFRVNGTGDLIRTFDHPGIFSQRAPNIKRHCWNQTAKREEIVLFGAKVIIQ